MAHSTWRAARLAVSIYLAIGTCAVTAQENRPGRATFAEMIAYARLAVGACVAGAEVEVVSGSAILKSSSIL